GEYTQRILLKHNTRVCLIVLVGLVTKEVRSHAAKVHKVADAHEDNRHDKDARAFAAGRNPAVDVIVVARVAVLLDSREAREPEEDVARDEVEGPAVVAVDVLADGPLRALVHAASSTWPF
ncbi:hypothetical protein SPRG_21083, partial [Saprolegnia parasitica CBS 223.65]